MKAAWLAAAAGIWLAALGTGGWVLWDDALTPGAQGTAPATWPEDAAIARTRGVATLVMFAHPQCPCTRASLTELASLVASLGGRVEARVVFVKPEGEPEAWVDTDLYTQAKAIPGALVQVDRGGVLARRFAAETSGQTVVYDAAGKLLFSGGITAFRGHPGDNAGRRRIASLVLGGGADKGTSLVFGCPLADPR